MVFHPLNNPPQYLYWVTDVNSREIKFPSSLLKDNEIQRYCDMLNAAYPCHGRTDTWLLFNTCLHPEHYNNFRLVDDSIQFANDLHIESLIRYNTKWRKPKAVVQPAGFTDWIGYKHLYELTLTQPADQKEPHLLLAGLKKIAESRMYSCLGYEACIELTNAGTPHIHALFFSAHTLDGTKIKKIYPYRYEFKRVRHPEKYYEYIRKEKDNNEVIKYCEEHKVPQFIKFINK